MEEIWLMVVYGMVKKMGRKYLLFKVDFENAYNSVDLGSLETCLVGFVVVINELSGLVPIFLWGSC